MYMEAFEELLKYVTSMAIPDEFVEARKEYMRFTGGIGDEEPSFEHRMQAFVEWYVFDRKLRLLGRTPLEMFLDHRTLFPEDAERFNGFFKTLWGIFELRRIGKGYLKLRDMWEGKDYNVIERRDVIGLAKGDLLETRIIPYCGDNVLSRAVVLHPPAIKRLLKKGIKKVKTEEKISRFEYFQRLSYCTLKLERYGNPEKLMIIYEKSLKGEYDNFPPRGEVKPEEKK